MKNGINNAGGEAKVERLLRRMLEGMGASLDRRLGRETLVTPGAGGHFTAGMLLGRMKRLIDERVVDRGREGRFAPHLMNLKIEWGSHSEAPPEKIKELEHEILAAAIDHINDHRYRTLAPVRLETTVDIFTTGVAVDPTFGELAEQMSAATRPAAKQSDNPITPSATKEEAVRVTARVNSPDQTFEKTLNFTPGGRRLGIGRASDADVSLPHPSVSKIHAALLMNREGTLLVADTGSTNGTYINGRRIAYGEARQIEEGDVVSFGEVEVRLRKI